jgi:poly(hydroxyalkanoate) depolymerase family esterase
VNYRLYVPEQHAEGRSLIVALHGCRQDAEDFAHGTRFDVLAERQGAIVLYPEQDERRNGHRCWNWFKQENQRRDGSETSQILALVERTIREQSVDRRRVFVAGLSAGASMAAILAETAPDVFSGVAAMAGVAPHCAHDVETAYAAMQGLCASSDAVTQPCDVSRYARARAIIWTGLRDRRVAPINALRLAERFARLYGLSSAPNQEETLPDGRSLEWHDGRGRTRVVLRQIEGLGHAWSGGSLRGSYTAPSAPSFSDAIFRFFGEREEAQAIRRCG